MDYEELAWAAGFFDAEGSSALIQGRYPALAIGQVDVLNLERFRKAVGFGSVTGPYPPRAGTFNKSPQCQLHIYKGANVVTTLLWPFLAHAKRTRLANLFSTASGQAVGANFSVTELAAALRMSCVASPPQTRRTELAWAAGFFDGDGGFYKSSRGARFASITQIDRAILFEFYSRVGLGQIYGPFTPRHDDPWARKPAYAWRTNRFEHVQALAALLWFKLGAAKRRQAIAILDGNGYCVKGHFKGGANGCPKCVAEMWARKREAGLCRKGHDKLGMKRCPTCAVERGPGGTVGEDAPPYAA